MECKNNIGKECEEDHNGICYSCLRDMIQWKEAQVELLKEILRVVDPININEERIRLILKNLEED